MRFVSTDRRRNCAAFAFLSIFAALSMSQLNAHAQTPSLPWPAANEIVAEVIPPVFPAQTFNVASFGASGNGSTDNTSAFARAITACNAAGGGMVEVPTGTYVCGAIELLSNVNFHLDSGATIKFSSNAALFPLVHTRYQGIDLMNFSPLVHAANQTNIAITGSGTFDATNASWNKDGSNNFTTLESEETAGTPITQRIFGSALPLRTTFVEPFNCTNVLIQGVTVVNSKFWQLHPCLCTNVTVDSVTTNSTSAQTDGCDPEGCTGVVIENCHLTAGDDCIAVKAGRNHDTLRVHKPSQYVVVMNSFFTGPWGIVTCGSEISDGVQHVYGYNLASAGTGVRYALYLKTNTLRGGYIQDINLDTVTGIFSHDIVSVDMKYNGETGTNIPTVQNITLNNISDTSCPQVLDLVGLSNAPINNMVISNSNFTSITNTTNSISNANVTYDNVTVNGVDVGSPAVKVAASNKVEIQARR
jgi:polygalacturonase